MRTKHLREQARARKAPPWLFFASGLRVHIKNICTSKDCLESANLNTWNSFDFFIRLLAERGKGMSDLGLLTFK